MRVRRRSPATSRSIGAACVALLAALSLGASAELLVVPPDTSFQGRLLDDSGAALEGPVDIGVRIFDAMSEGTLLYEELHTGVELSDGVFSLQIGTGSLADPPGGFGAGLFEGGLNRWLEVEVQGESLGPRLPFGSVAYALTAERAGSVAAIDEGQVTTLEILDGTIQGEDLAEGAIGAQQLAPGSVFPGAIASKAITSTNIQDSAIGPEQLARGSVHPGALQLGVFTDTFLAPGAITSRAIAPNSIFAGAIAPNTISVTHLAPNAVTQAALAPGAVYLGAIQPGAITITNILPGAVGAAQLARGSVHPGALQAGTFSSVHFAPGAITADLLAPQSVSAAALQQNLISAVHILPGAVTGEKIAPQSVTGANIAPGSGLYMSRADIYTATGAVQVVGANGVRSIVAFCTDPNDLPLQGSCVTEAGEALMRETRPMSWSNPTVPAGFECVMQSTAPGLNILVAQLTCVSVPD